MKKRPRNDRWDSKGNVGSESSDSGQLFTIINNTPIDVIKERKKDMANNYEILKSEIDELIGKIRTNVAKCDSLKLLLSATDFTMMNPTRIESESKLIYEPAQGLRLIEYIQSIIVTQHEGVECREDDFEQIANTVFGEIIELYEKCEMFIFAWAEKAELEKQLSENDILYCVEAQLMGIVRGKRYQHFQLADIRELLLPQSKEIFEIYGLSAVELIDGLIKLEYSLSSGKIDAYQELMDYYESYQKESQGTTKEEKAKTLEAIAQQSGIEKTLRKCFGADLYNVKNITGWSDELINSLSLCPGDETSFGNDDFESWPLFNLPVQNKPFITIDGYTYCFDYYNLFDNIYRVIQKDIRSHDKSYVNDWSQIQQHASERLVAQKFSNLLKGAEVYIGNYYPVANSLKQMDENDIIVIYDDIVLVIEVKAGSFTYTPAITDLTAHKASFNNLIKKADEQCSRTLEYIKKCSEAIFYDNQKKKKFSIKGEKRYYSFCVTVDNFNAFEAQIEKIKFFRISDGTIAISIDDLNVYEEYFDSSLCFLHFLKQRKAATNIRSLKMSDELDHLALYIEYNRYSHAMNKYRDYDNIIATGYIESLDAYYAGLHQPEFQVEKPTQAIPEYIKQMLNYMEANNTVNRVSFAEFLLDMGGEARTKFDANIRNRIKREAEIGFVTPYWVEGDFSYCCFVKIPGVEDFSLHKRYMYAFSNMHDRKKDNSWLINIEIDKDNNIEELDYECLEYKKHSEMGITDNDIALYCDFLKDNRNKQGIFVPVVKKKKIYPNELCPCGSGKKYKKCCGKEK